MYRQGKDGKFEDWSQHLPAINRLTWEVSALDFNLDRAQDIFFLRSYGNYNAGYSPKGEYGRLMLNVNDGKGTFSLPTVRQFDYIDKELDWWYGSCVDDLNGDKYPEVVECVDGQVRIHQTFLRTKAVAHPVYAEVPVGKAIQLDASSTHFPWGLNGTVLRLGVRGWKDGNRPERVLHLCPTGNLHREAERDRHRRPEG